WEEISSVTSAQALIDRRHHEDDELSVAQQEAEIPFELDGENLFFLGPESSPSSRQSQAASASRDTTRGGDDSGKRKGCSSSYYYGNPSSGVAGGSVYRTKKRRFDDAADTASLVAAGQVCSGDTSDENCVSTAEEIPHSFGASSGGKGGSRRGGMGCSGRGAGHSSSGLHTRSLGRNLYTPPFQSGRGGSTSGCQQAPAGSLSLSSASSRLSNSHSSFSGISTAGTTCVPDSPSFSSGAGNISESSAASYFFGSSRHHSELSPSDSLSQLADACKAAEATQSPLSSMSKELLASLAQHGAGLRQSGGKAGSLLPSLSATLQNHLAAVRGAMGGSVKGEEKGSRTSPNSEGVEPGTRQGVILRSGSSGSSLHAQATPPLSKAHRSLRATLRDLFPQSLIAAGEGSLDGGKESGISVGGGSVLGGDESGFPGGLGMAEAAPIGGGPAVDNWVQCEACKKWRRLPASVDPEQLPDTWLCAMNHWDPLHDSCELPEEEYRDTLLPHGSALPSSSATPSPVMTSEISNLLLGGSGGLGTGGEHDSLLFAAAAAASRCSPFADTNVDKMISTKPLADDFAPIVTGGDPSILSASNATGGFAGVRGGGPGGLTGAAGSGLLMKSGSRDSERLLGGSGVQGGESGGGRGGGRTRGRTTGGAAASLWVDEGEEEEFSKGGDTGGSSSEMAVAATHWGGMTTGSLFSTSAASIYSPQSSFSPSTPADAFTDGAAITVLKIPCSGDDPHHPLADRIMIYADGTVASCLACKLPFQTLQLRLLEAYRCDPAGRPPPDISHALLDSSFNYFTQSSSGRTRRGGTSASGDVPSSSDTSSSSLAPGTRITRSRAGTNVAASGDSEAFPFFSCGSGQRGGSADKNTGDSVELFDPANSSHLSFPGMVSSSNTSISTRSGGGGVGSSFLGCAGSAGLGGGPSHTSSGILGTCGNAGFGGGDGIISTTGAIATPRSQQGGSAGAGGAAMIPPPSSSFTLSAMGSPSSLNDVFVNLDFAANVHWPSYEILSSDSDDGADDAFPYEEEGGSEEGSVPRGGGRKDKKRFLGDYCRDPTMMRHLVEELVHECPVLEGQVESWNKEKGKSTEAGDGAESTAASEIRGIDEGFIGKKRGRELRGKKRDGGGGMSSGVSTIGERGRTTRGQRGGGGGEGGGRGGVFAVTAGRPFTVLELKDVIGLVCTAPDGTDIEEEEEDTIPAEEERGRREEEGRQDEHIEKTAEGAEEERVTTEQEEKQGVEGEVREDEKKVEETEKAEAEAVKGKQGGEGGGNEGSLEEEEKKQELHGKTEQEGGAREDEELKSGRHAEVSGGESSSSSNTGGSDTKGELASAAPLQGPCVNALEENGVVTGDKRASLDADSRSGLGAEGRFEKASRGEVFIEGEIGQGHLAEKEPLAGVISEETDTQELKDPSRDENISFRPSVEGTVEGFLKKGEEKQHQAEVCENRREAQHPASSSLPVTDAILHARREEGNSALVGTESAGGLAYHEESQEGKSALTKVEEQESVEERHEKTKSRVEESEMRKTHEPAVTSKGHEDLKAHEEPREEGGESIEEPDTALASKKAEELKPAQDAHVASDERFEGWQIGLLLQGDEESKADKQTHGEAGQCTKESDTILIFKGDERSKLLEEVRGDEEEHCSEEPQIAVKSKEDEEVEKPTKGAEEKEKHMKRFTAGGLISSDDRESRPGMEAPEGKKEPMEEPEAGIPSKTYEELKNYREEEVEECMEESNTGALPKEDEEEASKRFERASDEDGKRTEELDTSKRGIEAVVQVADNRFSSELSERESLEESPGVSGQSGNGKARGRALEKKAAEDKKTERLSDDVSGEGEAVGEPTEKETNEASVAQEENDNGKGHVVSREIGAKDYKVGHENLLEDETERPHAAVRQTEEEDKLEPARQQQEGEEEPVLEPDGEIVVEVEPQQENVVVERDDTQRDSHPAAEFEEETSRTRREASESKGETVEEGITALDEDVKPQEVVMSEVAEEEMPVLGEAEEQQAKVGENAEASRKTGEPQDTVETTNSDSKTRSEREEETMLDEDQDTDRRCTADLAQGEQAQSPETRMEEEAVDEEEAGPLIEETARRKPQDTRDTDRDSSITAGRAQEPRTKDALSSGKPYSVTGVSSESLICKESVREERRRQGKKGDGEVDFCGIRRDSRHISSTREGDRRLRGHPASANHVAGEIENATDEVKRRKEEGEKLSPGGSPSLKQARSLAEKRRRAGLPPPPLTAASACASGDEQASSSPSTSSGKCSRQNSEGLLSASQQTTNPRYTAGNISLRR
ncbi:cw-type zinc finger, partial [Cystoisospora suis]